MVSGELQQRLDALTEGTLDAGGRAELERLAAEDPAVREALDAYRPISSGARAKIVSGARDEMRRARRRRIVWRTGIFGVACAAATAVLMIGNTGRALPRYMLSVEGGDQALRGESSAVEIPRLEPSSRFKLILRPEVAVKDDVALALFERRGTALAPISLPVERSEQGAFKIEGLAKELFPDRSGELELVLEVGRPGDAPFQQFHVKIALRAP
jgi:hypothetical protein